MAWLCAALVLAITSLSASLRLAKAGIGCAPWPACHGAAQQALLAPPAAGDEAAQAPASTTLDAVRSAHRVLAVATLFLILVMGAACRHARRARAEWWALLAVTLFLAGLGPWSARSALPAVALGNLLGGFAMLALSVRLAAPRRWAVTPAVRAWLWAAAVALLAQIVLGGLASTTGSILSCDGLADCWRAAAGQGWAALDPWRLPGSAAGAPVQWLHRVATGAVLLLALPLAWRLRRIDAWGAGVLGAALLALAVLGPVMVGAGFAFSLALGHNQLAAIALAALARWL
ncbi:MAG: COX15/CtaA family protein [Burkholderiales bacterium]|nr:COX15/CtaA family protein [Burkholderiales bacterium]MBS0415596.1 COX15/CtaA family protein [Pseudomonadota bacterium]